jgi:hypothetical protein
MQGNGVAEDTAQGDWVANKKRGAEYTTQGNQAGDDLTRGGSG